MIKNGQIQNSIYFSIVSFFVLFTSCEQDIKLDLPEFVPEVVVICNFTSEEAFTLHVSKSKSYYSNNEFELVTDAEVQICRGSDLLENIAPPEDTSPDGNVEYTTQNLLGEVGETYTLKVEVEGLKPIIAHGYIPAPVEMTHTSVGAFVKAPKRANEPIQIYDTRVSLRFDDPAGQDNFYQVNFYQEVLDIPGTTFLGDTVTYLKKLVGYQNYDETLVSLFRKDNEFLIDGNNFDGEMVDLFFQPRFEYNVLDEIPRNIIIELRTVSKDYFQYYSSAYRQKQNENSGDISSSAIQIESNIQNGHGVFAGYSTKRIVAPVQF